MNLVIEFDERILTTIAENQVKVLLQRNDYSAGECARYVTQQTRDALKQIIDETDFAALVKEVALVYTKGIIESVVKEELKRMVRATVKDLKDKGQLISP